MQDMENLLGWTPSKACLLNNQGKLSFNLCNMWQFCISWFALLRAQQVSILNNHEDHAEFLRRTVLAEHLTWSQGNAAYSPCQGTGSGYFFPKSLGGHFPRECAWLHALSLFPSSYSQWVECRLGGTSEIFTWNQHFPPSWACNKLPMKQLGCSPAIPFSCSPIPGTKHFPTLKPQSCLPPCSTSMVVCCKSWCIAREQAS